MNLTLTDIVMANDPPPVLWGSTRRPQLGSPEDRRREAQYDRELAMFIAWGKRAASNYRRMSGD